MPVYVQFQLEVIPPRNKRTGSLNISGLHNRKGIDEIEPGGKHYPTVAKGSKILEWHEKDALLLLLLNITDTAAKSITEFEAKILTDAQAIDIKMDFFGITEKVESGVTK